MLTYKIHLIRHGITESNQSGLYTGRTDVAVSQKGVAQLERLCREYEYPNVEIVAVSPLKRCIQTADIFYPDIYQEKWDEFIECDMGQFEGKNAEQLQDMESFRDWLSGAAASPPGGERSEEIIKRISLGVHRLFYHMMDEKIHSAALITHGTIITSMLYGLGLPKRELKQCSAAPGCGYTLLMTPQLWMRDRAFEIYGVIPYGMTETEMQSN